MDGLYVVRTSVPARRLSADDAVRSYKSHAKVPSQATSDGTPVHSFQTLLGSLSTIVRNTCRRQGAPAEGPTFEMNTTPSDHQRKALELIRGIQV